MVNDISIPLEGAVKEVEGITSYTTESMNSVSSISLTIDESYDVDKVISELRTEIDKIKLPEGAEEPEVILPDIAGPDYQFSLLGDNQFELFEAYEEIKSDLNEIPQTAKIQSLNEIEQLVTIRLGKQLMEKFEITEAQVIQSLSSLGETLPVASQVDIDNDSTSIVTSLNGTDISDLKNLPFGDQVLSDFAVVSLSYSYENDRETRVGYDSDSYAALSFEVYVTENSDIQAYNDEITEIFLEYDDILYIQDDALPDKNEIFLVENYSSNEETQLQVNEIISGLFGAELNLESNLKYLGYLLGGIQLVLIVMLLFVSFRAAIIAALAIPLSLVFSNIYVFVTGGSLNTIVLFSLVLVIGLVVDPALVTLESIQRKKDAGFKGKEAAKEAVKDVGNGLFLATLTNIIVFAPFGVVSGLLGEIISYIPLTIIPAVIGSYVVPLVFLAWIGSFFLKRNKRSSNSEEDNLWTIAKILLSTNRWLIKSPVILRFFILAIAFAFPVLLTGYIFSQGHIKSVQFSGSQNSPYLMVAPSFYPDTSVQDQELLMKQVIDLTIEYDDITQVFPFQGQNSLFIILKDATEREERSVEIANELNDELKDEFGRAFFDISASVLSNGPPAGAYQVALGISSDDLEVLRESSLAIGDVLEAACLTDNKITLDEDCSEGELIVNKVDDGYTDKSSPVIEVKLDRKKLEEAQLTVPDAPLSILVYSQLNELFGDEEEVVGSVNVKGKDTDIVIYERKNPPSTINEIKNIEIISVSGKTIRLGDVAKVRETTEKSSIRRVNGQTISVVQARLDSENNDQTTAALVTQAMLDYYHEDEGKRLEAFDLEVEDFDIYQEGDLASFAKSFQELFIALFMAIFLSYLVLVVFFESFTQPLVILFTVPLTFLGVFPALALIGGGEFGFMEIIGLIILVGLVENVAIFLIDLAKQKINEGWDEHEAIAYASAIRLRPVVLTTLTAVASLAPLAVTSDQYRSMAIVIMFGLISSGITSLFTTPILFVFFRWLSAKYRSTHWINQILFFPLMPIYLLVWGLRKNR